MTEKTETMEIDLRELFGVVMQKLWLIIMIAVLAGAATFSITYFFVEPTYQASTLLYVNNSDISVGSTSFSISNSDLTAAHQLVDTYVVILESRTALNEVIEAANLDYTYEELSEMIEASAVNSTEIFEVTVTSNSPTEAEQIANTIAAVLPDKIADIVNGSDVRIVDYAVVPAHRFAPSYTKNTVIGALLGAVICAVVVVLTHMFDENIRTEDYLTLTYPDIPLLSVIPDMASNKQRGGYGYQNPPVNSRRVATLPDRQRRTEGKKNGR